jgi:hypothetical protein
MGAFTAHISDTSARLGVMYSGHVAHYSRGCWPEPEPEPAAYLYGTLEANWRKSLFLNPTRFYTSWLGHRL